VKHKILTRPWTENCTYCDMDCGDFNWNQNTVRKFS